MRSFANGNNRGWGAYLTLNPKKMWIIMFEIWFRVENPIEANNQTYSVNPTMLDGSSNEIHEVRF